MIKKSPGSHVIVPDGPVRSYSPELESYYEQLHRLLCNYLVVPESADSILLFCQHTKTFYYAMRGLLEDNFGVSKFVVDSLPTPEIKDSLKLLHSWENNSQGDAEYRSRLSNQGDSPFLNSTDCWSQYRWHLFEAARILEIARNRIDPTQPEKLGYRFPWLYQPHLEFFFE